MKNKLLENIRPILTTIAGNAELTEQSRKVAPENIELLRQTGFFRAFQPKHYGGLEVSFSDYAQCIVDIAQHCASTAWAGALLANHSHALGLYSRQLQDEIWLKDPDAIACSSVAPLGKWQEAEGGIILSGEFGWSSGSNYADWAILGYRGTNNMGQEGPCFAVVPKQDFELIENWQGAALKGSGSHTLKVDQVFVPEHRCESLFGLNFGLSEGFESNPGAIFNAPFSPIFSIGFSCVALGAAQRCLALFMEKTKGRVRAYNAAKVGLSSAAQIRIGESANQLTAAHLMLKNDWAEMDARAQSGDLPSMDDIMNWRSRQAYVIKMCIEAVDRLFSAAGGGAWMESNELQRLFRDVHIAGSHAQTDYDVAAETYGRYLLELPMDQHY